MNFANPDDATLRALLNRIKTIAVVGLSPQPARPSYRVAQAMQRYGYRIVPVRPLVDEVLGEKAYASLADIPFAVDLVDVFRAAEHVPAIVEQCLALHSMQRPFSTVHHSPAAIWIQEGIVHDDAAQRAQAGGMTVVMDRCLLKEYVRLKTE
ncbi:MAG: CoA-binding protein [Hydrogenophilales bacterium]|nr:CoA-binding protein [Hydrogenophilales bacterium]